MNINEPFEFIINNAGTDQSDKAIAVNLTSLFEIEDKFVTSDTDCVVNICSTSAHIGIENREYVASKGGVLAYTRQLAKKMATWGGRCVSISPGPVFTEMNGHIIDDVSKFKAVEAQNILHKWISPSEIADAIYFMCMNKSITGVDLLIDCGEHINHTEIK
jgi:NAD(P)-dependent dehydrogenase (short-subunit alcohol dehydrogenase family)